MATTAVAHADAMARLRGRYQGGGVYDDNLVQISKEGTFSCNTFCGSLNMVSLSSEDTMYWTAPGCIAGKVVNLMAKNTLKLGLAPPEHPWPEFSSKSVLLYAPGQLSVMTKHLCVGNLKILTLPKSASIFCQTLTFVKPTEESDDWFDSSEIVRSWVINDNVEVETLQMLNF